MFDCRCRAAQSVMSWLERRHVRVRAARPRRWRRKPSSAGIFAVRPMFWVESRKPSAASASWLVGPEITRGTVAAVAWRLASTQSAVRTAYGKSATIGPGGRRWHELASPAWTRCTRRLPLQHREHARPTAALRRGLALLLDEDARVPGAMLPTSWVKPTPAVSSGLLSLPSRIAVEQRPWTRARRWRRSDRSCPCAGPRTRGGPSPATGAAGLKTPSTSSQPRSRCGQPSACATGRRSASTTCDDAMLGASVGRRPPRPGGSSDEHPQLGVGHPDVGTGAVAGLVPRRDRASWRPHWNP